MNFLDYDEFAIRKLEDYFGSIYDEELDRMIVELVTGHEYEQNPKEVYDKHSESISKAREFLYNLADVADSENGDLCPDKGKFLRGIADIQEDSVFVRVLSKNIDELGIH